jgi:hypothetical protein
VADELEGKMRRRHPHLFDLGSAEPWERIKRRERRGRTRSGWRLRELRGRASQGRDARQVACVVGGFHRATQPSDSVALLSFVPERACDLERLDQLA